MEEAAKERLRQALTERGVTMKQASVRAKVGETFVRDVLERGRDPSVTKLTKVADYLGKSISDIVYGDGMRDTVPLKGYVGAGAEVYAFDDHQDSDGVRRVEAPPDATFRTVAVEVRGDSMAGIAGDGWLLYYDEREEEPQPDMIGKLCILWLEDGRVMAKKLYSGNTPGYWNILSTTTGTMETNVRIQYAALVKWIKPT